MVTIGFNKTAYSVSEDAGSVSITLSVQTGTLDRDVVVTLTTISGTALCKFQSVATAITLNLKPLMQNII